MELIWFKDGRPIEEAGIGFSFNDLWNRTLSLINANFAHEGIYKCQVRMKTGGPRLTKEAKITVIGNARQKIYHIIAILLFYEIRNNFTLIPKT